MKSFQDYITLEESLNQPFKWKWKDIGSKVMSAVFNTDKGRNVEFRAEETRPNMYVVEFKESGKRDYDTSNAGDAFRTFATVGSILAAMIRKNRSLVAIYWSSQEANRSSLYRKFARLIQKQSWAKNFKVTTFGTRGQPEEWTVLVKKSHADDIDIYDSIVDYDKEWRVTSGYDPKKDFFDEEVHLSEALESPLEYRWRFKERGYSVATFQTDGGRKIDVTFTQERAKLDIFELLFGDVDANYTVNYKILNKNDSPLRVFATVGKIVDDFVTKHSPKAIYWTAKEASRKKAYRALAKRMAKRPDFSRYDITVYKLKNLEVTLLVRKDVPENEQEEIQKHITGHTAFTVVFSSKGK